MKKFTIRELSTAIGRLQSLHTLPQRCEVCERPNKVELIVVTSTHTPVGICLLCGTSLIAHSVKRRNDNDTPLRSILVSDNRKDNLKKVKRGRKVLV